MWIEPDRTKLKLTDLVSHDTRDISYHDITYKQETNQLCRFPELHRFFFEEGVYNTAEWNNFQNILRFRLHNDSKLNDKDLVRMLYNAFIYTPNIAINIRDMELRESGVYIQEPFEEYRRRMIWEIQDYLGLRHYGYGKDLEGVPKFYRGNAYKESDGDQLVIKLD